MKTTQVVLEQSVRGRDEPRPSLRDPTMTRAFITGGTTAAVLALLALIVGYQTLRQDTRPAAATSSASRSPASSYPAEIAPTAESSQGFLYGRIITVDGAVYGGRLR